MKIFTCEQKRFLDSRTIEREGILSIDLMERAASRLFAKIMSMPDSGDKFLIVAGCGNNGGDGLALARLMADNHVDVTTLFCRFSQNVSTDCLENLQLLQSRYPACLHIIDEPLSDLNCNNHTIIDCLFGTGLTRSVSGSYASMIDLMNKSGCRIISVDVPSGVFCDRNVRNAGAMVHANATIAIETPPLSAMFAENYQYFGDVSVVSIDLDKETIAATPTPYNIIDSEVLGRLLRCRGRFDHKGMFGHAGLVVGSRGMAGAAILSARACLRGGVGLLTLDVPYEINDIVQTAVPEAMTKSDLFHDIHNRRLSAVGIGPGIGLQREICDRTMAYIKACRMPMVIDADGLNILAMQDKELGDILPAGTILTPHPKEFERLFGEFENTYAKICFMRDFSRDVGSIIVLKGGITAVSLPDGRIWFNISGNPGMATAGSGDVLTGILTALSAQDYSASDAALLGVALHAAAGDAAAKQKGQNALIASDIIDKIPEAFATLANNAIHIY